MADVDTRISPALHPTNIAALDGYSDETAPLVASATEALDAAYTYLGSIHDVRAAAFVDPTLTKEAALLKADDHARAKLAGVTRKFDSALAQFDKTITAYEADLSSSVKQAASAAVSGEVRSLMLKSDNRVALLEKALAEKDDDVLASVLGAPPMLSGLTREMHAVFLRKYNEQRKPETTQRLRALQSAKAYLADNGGLVLKEMVKAVGGLPVTDERTGFVVRTDGPDAIRAKRDASAKVYARHV